MHPNSNSNPAADVASASSMQPGGGGDRSSLYVNSVDHRQMVWSPQPPQYNFTSSSGHQQQQRFQSPPRGSSYYNQNNYSSSYSTPREQSEPPSSPPRITQNEGIGASSSTNLSMMSSIEETSSLVMEPPSNLKMMMLTKAASTCEEGSVKAEGREEALVDGRAQNDDFMSRVASPTREHLPLKKRKAMSKESVLLMEVDKLKEDLGKAELKIKVLEEENERLRQQQHRDATRSFGMSNACSSTSQLPFIPDLPGNTTSSPGKGAINQINQHEKHQHHMMKQQLHSIYRVPSSDQKLSIPQDVFIQRHHSDIGRPIPYHPYSTTTMNTDNYDHHHRQQPQQSQHIHRDRIDWMPPNNNNNDSSSATRTPEKKISFALSFDANAKGGSSKDSRGYNRCVSNRGRGSRPPLASRWKSR